MKKKGRLWIGTSGYEYSHWKGIFYPEGMPRRQWFARYSRDFDSVEINNTFYRLPSAATFKTWKAKGPKGFIYALKFSRYGSHLKRLKSPHRTIRLFYSRAIRLGEHLGPILVQLPPRWDVDVDRLQNFLRAAPPRQRWAIEFRDPRWLNDEVSAVLKSFNAALCIHDKIPKHDRELTADWVYLRFHGAQGDGNYRRRELITRAREIRTYLAAGLDVYVYFNNDVGGHALRNAAALRDLIAASR